MDHISKSPGHGEVVDIGGSAMNSDVGNELLHTLQAANKPGEILTLSDKLLYKGKGLNIWGEIISKKEFYQTSDEMALLDAHGDDIIAHVNPGVTMIDLGAGDTRKVERLLAAFEAKRMPAKYLALDISMESLEDNMGKLLRTHPASGCSVKCAGLWGTFEDGKIYVQGIETQRLFLSLGSVLCNDSFLIALADLKSWAQVMRPADLLLVGMDGHLLPKDEDKIWASYHSHPGLFQEFFSSGLDHANEILGKVVFDMKDWDLNSQLEKKPTTRHRWFLRAKCDVVHEELGIALKKGLELDWFDSHKYGPDNVQAMCSKAGLSIIDVWKQEGSEFRQYLLKLKNRKDPKEDADSGVSGLS